MSVQPFTVQRTLWLFFTLLLLITTPLTASAVSDMEEFLPPLSCGTGWKIEGKQLFYDKDTLSDRINGESELYFPYGFDRMAAARYAADKIPGAGIDVEIYRMGSLLDAFGMYANYRQKEGTSLNVGTESNVSGSQIVLYQGRYFIHIQMTGMDTANTMDLAECARTVASRIPTTKGRPHELAVFDRPEMVTGTERYLPRSLLGYDFLNRGIMADAVVDKSNLQVFFLLAAEDGSAVTAFDLYRSQLGAGRVEVVGERAFFLEGIDPLYGPVIVIRKGSCLSGALKFSEKKGIRAFLESLCK